MTLHENAYRSKAVLDVLDGEDLSTAEIAQALSISRFDAHRICRNLYHSHAIDRSLRYLPNADRAVAVWTKRGA